MEGVIKKRSVVISKNFIFKFLTIRFVKWLQIPSTKLSNYMKVSKFFITIFFFGFWIYTIIKGGFSLHDRESDLGLENLTE